MSNVLVIGGAGYIGSHMVKLLCEKGYSVTVLDNLSTGYRDAVILEADFIEGEFGDIPLLEEMFGECHFDTVMHFASSSQVGESVINPSKYYRNNVANTQNLLDAMVAFNIKSFVFSSTAAIFGEPQSDKIDEEHPKSPINPYGRTKLVVEQMLADYDKAYGLKSICLRYFNAAGADVDGLLGERHDPETHLIPLVLQAASGRRDEISIFGIDYETPDGSCLRDYIHVSDLCEAHLLALRALSEGGESTVYNLGNGNGFSVYDVINMARIVSDRVITVGFKERRPGDPERLVANSDRAKNELGWNPKYGELRVIIEHAWRWECRLLNGCQKEAVESNV